MYKENFGPRIKQARIEAGYTQKQIEEITGLAQSQIARYENGQLEPSLENIGVLAQFYNVSINWLLGVSIEPEIRPEKKS